MIYSNELFHAKTYEPKPRLCAGVYGYVYHRFPIKGGISWRDVMIRSASKPNPLLKLIRVIEK